MPHEAEIAVVRGRIDEERRGQQEIGHVEWDFTQHLPRGLSLESQGFVLVRREGLNSGGTLNCADSSN